MTTSTVKYLGNLRTEATHVGSGMTIITDAPIDNNGKGAAFSPTDLVASSLASCMITLMGITANSRQWNLDFCEASVTKTMAAAPRRISKIDIVIKLNETWNKQQRTVLEAAAKTCPVAFSLHSELIVDLQFTYIKQ